MPVGLHRLDVTTRRLDTRESGCLTNSSRPRRFAGAQQPMGKEDKRNSVRSFASNSVYRMRLGLPQAFYLSLAGELGDAFSN